MSEQSADWVPDPSDRGREGSSDWTSTLIRTKNGPVAVLANAITALRGAPEWKDVIVFDEFAERVAFRKAPPWGAAAGVVTDYEDRLAADWLQKQGILVGPEVAGQAVQVVARDCQIHPVREYLTGLKWDGTKRIDGWLNLYFGVLPSDYCTAVGARWLISAVARVFRPGVKADCCLIIEGNQGIKKSTALRVMGGDYFTDELESLGSKDAALQTRGVWIIEMAELDSLTRTEVGRTKAFMSRTVDRFRPPYGRHLIESPRQCVFAGSVNHNAYLRDETGGRRFWPVEATRILIDELTRDRNQLWAEAFHEYRAGAPWWLETAELGMQADDEQSARYEGDAWDSSILDWAEARLAMGFDSVSTSEVLDACIKMPPHMQQRGASMRVAACFRAAKWVHFRVMVSGRYVWRFRPPVGMTNLG